MSRLFTFILFAGLSVQPILAQGEPATVLVSGTGQVLVTPDEATVQLSVRRQGNTAAQAQQKANTAVTAILGALSGLEIQRERLQTSELRLNPIMESYRERTSAPPKILGYEAFYTLSVRVSDLGLVGPVIDAALANGSNQLQGVRYGLRDDLAARQQALRLAVEEARSKAVAVAVASGASLGHLIEIVEGTSPGFRPETRMMAQSVAAESTPVMAGQLSVSASVSIRFELKPD